MNADELADRVAHKMLAAEGTGPAWGIRIEEARHRYARVSMVVRRDMLNGHGIAHGGYVFLLADTAFAVACNSYGRRTVAAGCDITYLAPAKSGDELVAEARERARQGRSGIYDVSVRRADGSLVAELRGRSRTIDGTLVSPEHLG
jgi:acyl-CoA thioesterase